MMKLFLLAALLIVGSYGTTTLKTTTCLTSTDCSGDCTTVSGPLPSGCISANGVVSTMTTCENNQYNVTTWTSSSDCSGDGETISIPVGECYAPAGGIISYIYECDDDDSAMTLSVLFGGIMVLIASLFQ